MKRFARRAFVDAVKQINRYVEETYQPPREGKIPRTDQVVEFSLVQGTRGYIEKIVIQINGSYENGWYDACAVMLRKLAETLIIEAYEAKGIEARIKTNQQEYVTFENMINRAAGDLNLNRDMERILRELKQLGDRSAHNRRFYARRANIERLLLDIQTMVQELTSIAGFK